MSWPRRRTEDTEAYDLFLRSSQFHQAENSLAADAYDRADAFYRQAMARDPNLRRPPADLARSRLSRHWFISPLAPAELEEVKSLIDRALALAPNSPEAHFALGLFFVGSSPISRTRWQSSTARWNCNLTTPTRGRFPLGLSPARSMGALIGSFSTSGGTRPARFLNPRLISERPVMSAFCEAQAAR